MPVDLSRRRFLELTAASAAFVAACGPGGDEGVVDTDSDAPPDTDLDTQIDTDVGDTDVTPAALAPDDFGVSRLWRDDGDGVPRPVHWTRDDGSAECWILFSVRAGTSAGVKLTSYDGSSFEDTLDTFETSGTLDHVAAAFGVSVLDELRASLVTFA